MKLNEDNNTKPVPTSKLENSQPNLLRLSRSLAVQTNYPYPCTVCSNHQCQMDFQHCLSETLGQPFRICWMISTRSLLMRFRYAPIYQTSNVAMQVHVVVTSTLKWSCMKHLVICLSHKCKP